MNFKELLRDKVSQEEFAKIRKSFEIIGDVVIIEIPDEIYHIKDEIVRAILTKHKRVKTILRKVKEVSGEFRVAKYEIIYGKETETIAKEHGCKFKVDPTKVYFTVKLSGERERIARMVKKDERVLVMFAGVGPYAIVIAKLAKPKEVIGVELNPIAVRYFRENVRLNRVEDVVEVIEGDVREIVPKLNGKFDRILMPAPYMAENFVGILKEKVKIGTWIHFYTFAGEEENLQDRIVRKFEEIGVKVNVKRIKECGSFAPRVNRYVADLVVDGVK